MTNYFKSGKMSLESEHYQKTLIFRLQLQNQVHAIKTTCFQHFLGRTLIMWLSTYIKMMAESKTTQQSIHGMQILLNQPPIPPVSKLWPWCSANLALNLNTPQNLLFIIHLQFTCGSLNRHASIHQNGLSCHYILARCNTCASRRHALWDKRLRVIMSSIAADEYIGLPRSSGMRARVGN